MGGEAAEKASPSSDGEAEEEKVKEEEEEEEEEEVEGKAIEEGGLEKWGMRLKRKSKKKRLRLEKEAAAADKRGVCYLSRIPPHMTPLRLRQILSHYGELQRIYLAPEDPSAQVRRKRAGGFRGQGFSEGWVEFTKKSVAKLVAKMLNGEQIAFFLNPKYHYSRRLWEENDLKMAIHEVYDRLFPESPEAANFGNELLAFKDARGLFASMAAVRSRDKMMPCGKKRSSFYYDLWNIRYLSKFKWDDLTEEIAYKNAIREQKLALEISAAKRERDFYLSKVDTARGLSSMRERLKKKQKVQEGLDSNADSAADILKPKVIRKFKQTRPVVDTATENKPKLAKDFLAGIFGGSSS